MGALGAYANQSISHQVAGVHNEYDEITYGASATIKGRKEATSKLIRTPSGQEIVSVAMVMTETAVAVNDKLDSRLVIASEPAIDLGGNILFYEVYLI
jgi:hypothetical protein